MDAGRTLAVNWMLVDESKTRDTGRQRQGRRKKVQRTLAKDNKVDTRKVSPAAAGRRQQSQQRKVQRMLAVDDKVNESKSSGL